MEKELEKEVNVVEEKISISEPAVDIPQLEEQEAKEILHDVLNELYYSKGKKRLFRHITPEMLKTTFKDRLTLPYLSKCQMGHLL